jgi:predicted Fe-S protein YdhL (DUF1289 family)
MSSTPVPSPCTQVCTIDPGTGLCTGCLRSLDEIAAWGSLDEGGKRRVWERLALRRAQLSGPWVDPDLAGAAPGDDRWKAS